MRYLPLTDADRQAMLAAIGAPSIEALFEDVPPAARHPGLLDLPLAMGEMEVERRLGAMAAKNLNAGSTSCFLGGGAYRHHVPAAVVESAKAASEVYAPVSGEVVAVNDAIVADPAKVNADAMGEGWFLKLRLADPKQLDSLMDQAAYEAFVAQEPH